MLFLLQNPIVVDVSKQPEAAHDISIDVVLGMFAMAGVLLAVMAAGSAIVALVVLLYRRRRDANGGPEPSHTQLRI